MKLLIAIIATLCFVAGPALAQAPASGTQQKPPAQHQPGTPAQPAQATKPAAAPSAEKADPAKDAAIRHLMDITQTAKLGDNIGTYLTNQVRAVMSRSLTADRLPKFMDAFSQKFAAGAPSAAVTTATVAIYARGFSMEDIQGLIQFYESPLGQRVVKTLPQVAEESQTTGAQIEQKAAMSTLESMQDEYPELKPMLQPQGPAQGTPQAPGGASAPAPTPQSSPTPKPPSPPQN
ncbi:MAG: DUF2059 domain-containing protein [Candidatus Acidiferrales bacterium]|jgi:hypothetical protein